MDIKSQRSGIGSHGPLRSMKSSWRLSKLLGGTSASATPEGILHLMVINGLTAKQIGSHLQKHRLRHQNAKQGGQRQENDSRKLIPAHRLRHQNAKQGGQRQENASRKLMPAHDEATPESITPRVGEGYPFRLWTRVKERSVDTTALKNDMDTCISGNYREDTESVSVWDKYENKKRSVDTMALKTGMDTCISGNYREDTESVGVWDKYENKKRSVDTAALKTNMDTCISGNYREDTESVGVWDKYENNLQRVFSEKKKRWQFMSKQQWPGKNIIVIADEGDPNEAPKTAGGASIEISGSRSLSSDQVRENNRAETDRHNDNSGSINLPQGHGAFAEISGSSNMLRSNQVGNVRTEFSRDNDHMENLLEVYGASKGNAGSSSMLASSQVGKNNVTEAARNNDTMGNHNLLEGIMDPEYASMGFSVPGAHLENNYLDLAGPSDGREEAHSFWMSQQESLGLEDLCDNACNDALRSVGLINVDEPVNHGSQEQQSLGMEDHLQVDGIALDDVLKSLINSLDEPMTEEAAVEGPQNVQSLAPEVLQAGDNAWGDDLRSMGMINLLNEPITHEAAIGDTQVDDPMTPIAQSDALWAWSPAVLG